MGALGVWPPPVSSVQPRRAMEVRAHPTNCGAESNLLEIRLYIGQSWYSTLDLCWCLSEVATAQHQPSTSGRGMTVKWAEWEIHSGNASATCVLIPQGRITLQNVHDHSCIPGDCRRVWMLRAVSHCYLQ